MFIGWPSAWSSYHYHHGGRRTDRHGSFDEPPDPRDLMAELYQKPARRRISFMGMTLRDRKLEAARERRTQKRLAARRATLDGQSTTARM